MSILKEKPVSRTRVKTAVRSSRDRVAISGFLTDQCKAGRQAYVVYPVIEESERVDLKAATTMAEELEKQLAPLRVGLVHGRMKSDERNDVMRLFRDGGLDVLVATTVIEVGIDVPNATVMVIEHPERFGLAQLHQLRGRVGRGSDESHCLLICDDFPAMNRLKRFAKTSDGFRISEMDLKERGLGDLAGVRQSGGFSLRFADLSVDGDLVNTARTAALQIIESDPALEEKKHEALRARIERRYERGMELFRVG
jgi:ATP-dependent DNA helicase RecG